MSVLLSKVCKFTGVWLQFICLSLSLASCRAFLRVSACLGWCKAAAAPLMTSVRSSRRTSSVAFAASRRSTAWAKRRCWAPGSPNTTPSTGETMTCGVSHSGRTSAPCRSSSSAKSSCTRCSSRSSASASLSTSCCTTPARWVRGRVGAARSSKPFSTTLMA